MDHRPMPAEQYFPPVPTIPNGQWQQIDLLLDDGTSEHPIQILSILDTTRH